MWDAWQAQSLEWLALQKMLRLPKRRARLTPASETRLNAQIQMFNELRHYPLYIRSFFGR